MKATQRKGVLRPFHFVSLKGERQRTRTFYAADAASAARIALRWGTPRGFKMYRKRLSP